MIVASLPILAVQWNRYAPSESYHCLSQEQLCFLDEQCGTGVLLKPSTWRRIKSNCYAVEFIAIRKDSFWVRKNTRRIWVLESPEITGFCIWVTCQQMNGAITLALISSHWRERKLKAMLLLLLAQNAVAEYYLGEFDVFWCGCFFSFWWLLWCAVES